VRTISGIGRTQLPQELRKGLRMRDDKLEPHGDREQQIRTFVSSACAGDIDAMRAQVAEGLDLNGREQFGDTLLELVISELEYCPEAPKYKVVQEMLWLGADPCRLSEDGSSPLFTAILNMDTEMLRILLDGGADPNVLLRITLGAGADPGIVEMETLGESLYDWADFAYRYDVWNMRLPEEATAAERSDKDAWLRYLDRLAVKHGKRRPDHLRLLSQRGALSMAELRQRRQTTNGLAQHAARPLVRLDRRRGAHRRPPLRPRQNQRGAPR
jgi:ankyrin repeat protein